MLPTIRQQLEIVFHIILWSNEMHIIIEGVNSTPSSIIGSVLLRLLPQAKSNLARIGAWPVRLSYRENGGHLPPIFLVNR